MTVEPQEQHRWLEQLVGEWTAEMTASMGPDQPPQTFHGTESVRSLGGVWTIGEGTGETPGGTPTYTIMTLGYDPAKKKFLGTFFGSMMTHLWLYEGELDAAGKVLTLDTEGPSFTAEGKYAKYQDIIEFVSNDHRTLKSRTLGDDGQWTEFMQANYRRKK